MHSMGGKRLYCSILLVEIQHILKQKEITLCNCEVQKD